MDLIRDHVLETVIKMDKCSNYPNFISSGLIRGHFLVSCNDESTKTWLSTQVPTWNLWEGAKLEVVEQSKLPQLETFSVFIPSKPEVDASYILKGLEVFNKNLITEDWQVIRCMRSKAADEKQQSNGYILVVGMDETSAAEITGPLKMKPFYSMTRVHFRRIKKAVEEAEALGGPSAAVSEEVETPDGESTSAN